MMGSTMGRMGPLASIVCGIITLIVIGGIYFSEMAATSRAGCTKTWKQTEGSIDSTYQKKTRVGLGASDATYVCYFYVAGAKRYISSQVYYDQFGDSTVLPPGTQFFPGQSVTVFYNPDEPQHAVLIQGAEPKKTNTSKYLVGAFLGLSLCIAGIFRLAKQD